MNRKLRLLAIVAIILPLGACVVYEPIPVTMAPQMTVQQRFDRAWAAAGGAMYDQGLNITVQDRGAGVIRGERSGITISATLETLADGSVQVKFNSRGATSTDPSLINRVSDSYDRRMGR